MSSKEEAGSFGTMATAAPEENEVDDTKSRQEKEEKLLLTAWQSMSSALRLHSLSEDFRSPGQSFLAKQRQSTQARRAPSASPQPRSEPPSAGRRGGGQPTHGQC